jgi:hypothetical protein
LPAAMVSRSRQLLAVLQATTCDKTHACASFTAADVSGASLTGHMHGVSKPPALLKQHMWHCNPGRVHRWHAHQEFTVLQLLWCCAWLPLYSRGQQRRISRTRVGEDTGIGSCQQRTWNLGGSSAAAAVSCASCSSSCCRARVGQRAAVHTSMLHGPCSLEDPGGGDRSLHLRYTRGCPPCLRARCTLLINMMNWEQQRQVRQQRGCL